MKFIAYAFLSFTIAPIIGIIIGIPFDKYLLKNYPVVLFTVIIIFSSLGIYSLYLYKKSYKYVNDAVLAIFTGWVALTYLLTGEKTSEIIPSEKLIETHPLMYYLIILKLTIVANGLLAKIFITLNELYHARKAENKSGKYTDVLKMTISSIKSFFNSQKDGVKK
ncbi:TPA: hypothetical protein ACXE0W_001756 [Escherichia coli]|uniref:hypothetical protein n=1 Tax=Enterobacteriaceae TaxID=543 RepID=UPI00050AA0F1|nr:hypothetical protein [Escherichia coli]EFK4689060.1 hypothetical protein [Escherichia coli]EFN7138386.1 hypothetical protein [Escherichia coli]EIP6819857.1 hypothetical protein [Escherichia coli]EIY1226719.1 hypothetical protein [Escherichia coli]EKG5973130.1 hypothetical protein [Escherichia coli]